MRGTHNSHLTNSNIRSLLTCQSCLSVRSLLGASRAASGSSARRARVTAAKWLLGGPPVKFSKYF